MSTTHRTTIAAVLTASALTLVGCVAPVHTGSNTPQENQAEAPTATPARPSAELPNQPGREYPNQHYTYTPPPRQLPAEDIPDYSWLPKEPTPISPDTPLFSPCEELPEEVFTRIGMTPLEPPFNGSPLFTNCPLAISVNGEQRAISIGVDQADYRLLAQEGLVLSDATDSTIPGAIYVDAYAKPGKATSCNIGVYTAKGRLYVDYASPGSLASAESDCPIARDFLEAFLEQPEARAALIAQER